MRQRLYNATTLVRALLLSRGEIQSLVGQKVFPVIAPDETEGDFITLTRVDYERDRSKQGIYSNVVVLEVAIVSDDYDRGVRLAEEVDNLLEVDGLLAFDPASRLLSVALISSSEDYQEYKYIQILNYEIQYQ